MTEERLVDIEIKLARQEDLVDALNKMVYQQQVKLDELESLCRALAGRLKEMANADSDAAPLDERPPHY